MAALLRRLAAKEREAEQPRGDREDGRPAEPRSKRTAEA
jgi:hypothetical protein